MDTETLAAIILLLLFSALVLLLLTRERKSTAKDCSNTSVPRTRGTYCPLCGEFLHRGKKVHSELFPGKDFDLMRIYGCQSCRTQNPLHPRRCPYCQNILPENGYVMAQVYRKPCKPPHVHVYGCTRCKPGRG